ncbi:MAG: prohead protease/major capsid protein fusion protein, partial [Solimonas sp.]
MTQQQTRFLPTQQRAASVAPSTFNKADRTVEVVWTTGARVRRRSWDGSYDEELVVDASAIDLIRLNTGGAPVLNTHSSWSLQDQIGIVERAWIANGEGRAILRLSEREEVAGIVRDIEAGLIKNISVGYNVRKYEIISAGNRTDGGTVPLYRAID